MTRRWGSPGRRRVLALVIGGAVGCNFSTEGPWDYECTPKTEQACAYEPSPPWLRDSRG